MIYLAAPYSHPKASVREARMKAFYKYDAQLMSQGKFTVSPLFKVETAKHGKIPDSWDYWKEYSYELLAKCDCMHVLMMEGWDESPGVTAELVYCTKHNIPVEYITIES